jgi:predicted aspartyl protease
MAQPREALMPAALVPHGCSAQLSRIRCAMISRRAPLRSIMSMKAAKHLIVGLALATLGTLPAASETIQLQQFHGIYMVPVRVNDAVAIPFVLDSGASEVAIPEDVFLVLLRSGTVDDSDFIGTGTYVMADGSKQSSRRFVLHKMAVGIHIITNVVANVVSVKGDPLLGQSFLSELPTWTIDNARHALVLNGGPAGEPQQATVPIPTPPSAPIPPASLARVLNPGEPATLAAIRGQQKAQSCFDNYHQISEKMDCLTSVVHTLENQRFELLGFTFYAFILQGKREETIHSNPNYDDKFKQSLELNVKAYQKLLQILRKKMSVPLNDLCIITQIDCSVASRVY